jgi:hypothetical protein
VPLQITRRRRRRTTTTTTTINHTVCIRIKITHYIYMQGQKMLTKLIADSRNQNRRLF